MSELLRDIDTSAWNRLAEAEDAWYRATQEFLGHDIRRVPILRRAIKSGNARLALGVANALPVSEKMALFSLFVMVASEGTGLVQIARDIIASLPREWVLDRINEEAEPYLKDGTDWEFRRFLERYCELDSGLAINLARRAAAHPDAEVREAGEEFLQALGAEA